MISISWELLFQIINIILWILIPIVIYRIIKKYKENKVSLNKRINTLEKKVNDLQSR